MEAKKKRKTEKALKVPAAKELFHEKYLIFGKNMRLERKERGFTSDVLARFLGISTAYVGLIERGERRPSLETFIRICDFFGETYEDMLKPNSALTIAEKKLLSKSTETKDLLESKRKMLTSMVSTFGADELDYIINILKNFKHYNQVKREGFADEDFDFEDGHSV